MVSKIKKILFLIILAVSFSCEEQGIFVNCPDCTAEEPLEANLEIKTGKNNNGNSILINVYEGNLEDNVLNSSFSVTETSTTILVMINKKYTVTATYNISSDYYIAVDSATPRVRYDKAQCDNPCYFVYDRVVDLRLKYTK